LAEKDVKNVESVAQSTSAITHSYTIQPVNYYDILYECANRMLIERSTNHIFTINAGYNIRTYQNRRKIYVWIDTNKNRTQNTQNLILEIKKRKIFLQSVDYRPKI